MAIFSLQYLLNGLRERETRPVDFAAAVLRLSVSEQQAIDPKDNPQQEEPDKVLSD